MGGGYGGRVVTGGGSGGVGDRTGVGRVGDWDGGLGRGRG